MVSEQSPPPGTQVATGATVIVNLGEAPAVVTVPDVVGNRQQWTESMVSQLIEANDLRFVRGEDVVVPFGDACNLYANSQIPAADEVVAPQSEIEVRFCQQEEATVPDVLGRTEVNARSDITTAGLQPAFSGACDPDNGLVDRVVWQDPAPDEIVEPNSVVRYWSYQAGVACPAPA